MGMRQPARLTATGYGLPEDALEDLQAEDPGRARVGMFMLFFLVIGLAIATLWYVALPTLERKPVADRGCEVVILGSGSPSCVKNPVRATHVKPARPKH